MTYGVRALTGTGTGIDSYFPSVTAHPWFNRARGRGGHNRKWQGIALTRCGPMFGPER